MTREPIHIGYTNQAIWQLTNQAVPDGPWRAVDWASVTRVVAHVGDQVVDSDSASDALTWAEGVLVMTLGQALPADTVRGDQPGRLILFSFDYPDGLVWSDDIIFEVR